MTVAAVEKTLVASPAYQVTWAGREVTVSLAPYILSMTYTDHAHGRSDELEISLEDLGGGWKDGWYPQKGDVITARIGYRGAPLLPCGDFQIEEFEAKGPPDTAHVRALSAGVTRPLRTKNSKAYEGVSLRGIAAEVAARHGLTLVGQVADLRLKRVTQNQERDLGFLKRIAYEHGQVFAVKGDQLVFMERSDLTEREPVATLTRSGITSYSIRDKGLTTYKGARACYDDPWDKATHEGAASTDAPDGVEDAVKLTGRSQSADHARLQARAALAAANEARFTGSVEVMGDTRLTAGNTVELAGLGRLSGVYLISSSRHACSREAGYTTHIEVTRGG